jgi:hypothetical protein
MQDAGSGAARRCRMQDRALRADAGCRMRDTGYFILNPESEK